MKQYRQLSYEELAFHLDDSSAFRTFSRLEMGQYPCKSILQEKIKSLSEETWEAIHSRIIGYAQSEKIETGRKIRIDSTAIETDIHHPTDTTLLCDGIRVITRWLAAGKQLSPQPIYPFSDHTRADKKRLMVILNTPKEKVRLAAYRELLSYAQRVVVYAESAIPALRSGRPILQQCIDIGVNAGSEDQARDEEPDGKERFRHPLNHKGIVRIQQKILVAVEIPF